MEYPSASRILTIPSEYPFALFSLSISKDLDLLVKPCGGLNEVHECLVEGSRDGQLSHMLMGLCDAIVDEVSDMYGTMLVTRHG
jgi:hypothetical protein